MKQIDFLARRLVLAAACLCSVHGYAQTYPGKPIQLVVPYAAGGSTDLAGRIVAKAMTEQLGAAVVVDNRVGAAGIVGVSQALRAPADGYTSALSGVSTTLLHELLGRKLPYAPGDMNAVAYLGSSGMAIVTRNASPLNTVADVIAQSKKKPGAITFGTAGDASPAHLATEYLSNMAQIQLTHVPYTGDSAILSDLVSGRVDIAVVGVASVFAQIAGGTLKTIALTSAKRLASLPQVPTVAESGIPGYEADIWNLLVLPKGTPPGVDQKLNQSVNQLVQQKSVQDALLKLGMIAQPMTLPEIQRFMRAERQKWSKVIQDARIKID